MITERAKRKLSAVLSADVKGYSRLMGRDEAGTVGRLKEYRALVTGLVQEYRGRVVDSPGDNILADSSISDIFVIARNSTFVYKNKPVKIQQVSEELGVRHVLEGSVQKSGDNLRITAQLIDATTGYHLWVERYDRKLTPYCPDWYLSILGQSYRQAGRYKDAFAVFGKALERSKKNKGNPISIFTGFIPTKTPPTWSESLQTCVKRD